MVGRRVLVEAAVVDLHAGQGGDLARDLLLGVGRRHDDDDVKGEALLLAERGVNLGQAKPSPAGRHEAERAAA